MTKYTKLRHGYTRDIVLKREEESVPTISSLEVAEMVGRQHKDVLRDIRTYIDHLNERKSALVEKYFISAEYIDRKGQVRPSYELTKKGCELYATRMTGAKGTQFAVAYIERFNEMEEELRKTNEPRILSKSEWLAASLELTILANQKLEELDEKVDEHEQDIDYLKKDMRIDRRQERILQRKGAKKVIQELGGKHTNAYDKCSRKAFAELWGSFKNYFEVGSYSDIPRIKFEEACDYINVWRPSTRLAIEIKGANRQMSLDIKNGTVTTRGGDQ